MSVGVSLGTEVNVGRGVAVKGSAVGGSIVGVFTGGAVVAVGSTGVLVAAAGACVGGIQIATVGQFSGPSACAIEAVGRKTSSAQNKTAVQSSHDTRVRVKFGERCCM